VTQAVRARTTQATDLRRADVISVSLLTVTALAIRLVRLGEQSLWLDEAFSWLVASRPLAEGLEIARVNFVNPPLYYLLLHPVAQIGHSEALLRLPSALFGAATVPLLYALGRRLHRPRAGIAAAALLAFNPFHMWVSREARSYALLCLLAALVLASFLQRLSGRRGWLAFTGLSALAYLTHYFALLLALAQFIFFLLTLQRRHRLFRRWVLAQAVAFAPLAIWLAWLFTQETQSIGIGWIPRPAWWAPLLTLWDFGLLYVDGWWSWGFWAVPLFAVALACGLWNVRRRLLLGLWLVVPVLAVLLISWGLGRYFYVDRYFVTVLPAYVLLSATGAIAIRHLSVGRVVLVGMLLASSISIVQTHVDPALRKEDWRAVASYLTANIQPGDRVVLRQIERGVPLAYYAPDLPWTYAADRPEPDPWSYIEAGYRRLWLVWDNPQASNHLGVSSRPLDIFSIADPGTRAWLDDHRADCEQVGPFAALAVLRCRLRP
jgi:mannosyltransferase